MRWIVKNREWFRCYSVPLLKKLKEEGCRYEFVAKDIVNDKTFWLFMISDDVSHVLENWDKKRL